MAVSIVVKDSLLECVLKRQINRDSDINGITSCSYRVCTIVTHAIMIPTVHVHLYYQTIRYIVVLEFYYLRLQCFFV